MIYENIKAFPKDVISNQQLIERAVKLGCTKAKLILTKTISLGHWIKLHCQYGCSHYGSLLTCPPYSPNIEEMGDILGEYKTALLIYSSPYTNAREIVIELEKYLKEKGYGKAFALCAQPCDLCDPCTVATNCQYPEKARPTLQSCGIDVNQTIQNNGWTDLNQQVPCTPDHAIGMVLLA
jgi:predicted metal-binding protein